MPARLIPVRNLATKSKAKDSGKKINETLKIAPIKEQKRKTFVALNLSAIDNKAKTKVPDMKPSITIEVT